MSFLKIKHILEEMIVSIKSHQYVLELLEFSMSQAIEKFFSLSCQYVLVHNGIVK